MGIARTRTGFVYFKPGKSQVPDRESRIRSSSPLIANRLNIRYFAFISLTDIHGKECALCFCHENTD